MEAEAEDQKQPRGTKIDDRRTEEKWADMLQSAKEPTLAETPAWAPVETRVSQPNREGDKEEGGRHE